MMYCDVPKSLGIDVSHLSSPIVLLDYYKGLAEGEGAPAWCHWIQAGDNFEFKQP